MTYKDKGDFPVFSLARSIAFAVNGKERKFGTPDIHLHWTVHLLSGQLGLLGCRHSGSVPKRRCLTTNTCLHSVCKRHTATYCHEPSSHLEIYLLEMVKKLGWSRNRESVLISTSVPIGYIFLDLQLWSRAWQNLKRLHRKLQCRLRNFNTPFECSQQNARSRPQAAICALMVSRVT